ncbi:MAG: divergent PAP2 family protein [Selenomonadaceae bacterium]|nr:divergent PAP2 family protein [Selenomonadaceae bacterium]
MKFFLLPFVAWIISGSLKFLVNSLKFGIDNGKKLIGYGGLPSTHTTIISSAVFFYGFSEGFFTPTFTLGLSVLLLFAMDAHNLRIKIGTHAKILNSLQNKIVLRERMGHTWLEIICGLILGAILGYIFANFL